MPHSDSQTFLGTSPQTVMRECEPLKSEGAPSAMSEARDNNANFAWFQHMLHNLATNRSMALLLANGSVSSNSSGERVIRLLNGNLSRHNAHASITA